MSEISHQLKNCAKSGCIRVIAASALEKQLGVPMADTITLKRAEAVGLFALASTLLKSVGDRFIADMSDDMAMELAHAMDNVEVKPDEVKPPVDCVPPAFEIVRRQEGKQ